MAKHTPEERARIACEAYDGNNAPGLRQRVAHQIREAEQAATADLLEALESAEEKIASVPAWRNTTGHNRIRAAIAKAREKQKGK